MHHVNNNITQPIYGSLLLAVFHYIIIIIIEIAIIIIIIIIEIAIAVAIIIITTRLTLEGGLRDTSSVPHLRSSPVSP